MNNVSLAIDRIYETLDGSRAVSEFIDRHGIASLNVLTVLNADDARNVVAQFAGELPGRRVVEIGSGVGYLALELAKHAKSVVAIESDPAWSWIFTKFLYRAKPPNLTWIFGQSEEIDLIADVAVISSRSGLAEMIAQGRRLAPVIVLICCAEAVVCASRDPLLDHLADYTKKFIEDTFEELSRDPEMMRYCAENSKP